MRKHMGPREAKRMMKRMGLGMGSIPNVEQVIIRTSQKELILEEPEVSILDVQGQRIYQIVGGKLSETTGTEQETISEEDVRLVADQTGKSVDEAKQALIETGGDLAKAILLLQS